MTVGRFTVAPPISREGRNWVDNLLIGFATICATFSGGQAVASGEVAFGSVIAVIIGTLFSGFIASRYADRRFVKLDGLFYLAVALVAYFGSRGLNTFLPEETFPRELLPSSWLIWMMVLGSPFLWRDSSLLFQAIPALALFGFVGCYDTFREVVFFFFTYLICIATLFARAHARDMALRAERSGYFGGDLATLRAGGQIESRLRKGPWRWVAGPEWALWSAATIVVLSFLGAPVLRRSVAPISGIAKIVGPAPRRQQPAVSGQPATRQTTTRIAQGPVELRNTPAFDIEGTTERYFRTDHYERYSSGVWIKDRQWLDSFGAPVNPKPGYGTVRFTLPNGEVAPIPERNAGRAPGRPPEQRRAVESIITSRSPTIGIPLPGEFIRLGEKRNPPTYRQEGPAETIYLPSPQIYERLPVYTAPVAPADLNATSGKGDTGFSDPMLNLDRASARYLAFARKAAGGDAPDGTRAERLRDTLSKTIRYNINASAAPLDSDPVERAIFETREGYCDVFASSMVIGARAIGIPARYSVGYYGDSRSRTADGVQVLLESDRHAWAELYFRNVGWVVYDATDGATIVPGGDRRANGGAEEWYRQPWVRQVGDIAIIGLIVVGAGFLLWPRRKDARVVERARNELVGAYLRATSRGTKRDRRLDETLSEHLDVVGPDLGENRREAREIVDLLEGSLYGTVTLDAAEVASLRKRVGALGKALRSK